MDTPEFTDGEETVYAKYRWVMCDNKEEIKAIAS
jgi:hypothetical protein